MLHKESFHLPYDDSNLVSLRLIEGIQKEEGSSVNLRNDISNIYEISLCKIDF
jgi:hypothetical protein